MVEGKGQTRSWLIIASLPAGKFIVNISSIWQRKVSVASQLYDIVHLVYSLSNTYIINFSLLHEKPKTKMCMSALIDIA
jgi:hypothetical protein